MTTRDEVRATLDALCEGQGVSEDDDGGFAVDLGDAPRWVRVCEDPTRVVVFGTAAADVARTDEVDEYLNDFNRAWQLFRAFWENGVIIVRADLPAEPFVPRQLQMALDDFDSVASDVAQEASEWSPW